MSNNTIYKGMNFTIKNKYFIILFISISTFILGIEIEKNLQGISKLFKKSELDLFPIEKFNYSNSNNLFCKEVTLKPNLNYSKLQKDLLLINYSNLFPIKYSSNCKNKSTISSNIDLISNKKSNDLFLLQDTCLSGHETDIWYPSCDKVLNFYNTIPTIDIGYKGLDLEACNAICDRNGNLLFYSDNELVYDKTHNPIKGSGNNYIYGSSSMSLILPKPNSDSIYYWITPDDIESNGSFKETKMYYHVINMNRNGGLGEIIQTKLILMDTSSERVTAVRHCNGKDWWIVGENALNERLFVWLLDENGINLVPNQIYDAGFRRWNNYFGIGGQMKFSPDGSVLAEHNYQINGQILEYFIGLHKFDPSAGLFYSSLNINYPDKPTFYHYGIEFSASGRYLYLSELNVNQFDLKYWDADSISRSKVSLGKLKFIGAPSLCKDGKIYHTTSTPIISIIHNPEKKGIKCNLELNALNLGPNNVAQSSPSPARGLMWPNRTFIKGEYEACPDSNFIYYISDPCKHDPAQWTMLDSAVLKSNQGLDTVEVYFPKPGIYRISSAYPARCGYKSDTVTIEVKPCLCNIDVSWKQIDSIICQGNDAFFQFKANTSNYHWTQNSQWTDSIRIPNLLTDSCLELKLIHPRFCDTTIQICIKVNDAKINNFEYTICTGDSIEIFNKWVKEASVESKIYNSTTNCDSTVNITINLKKIDTLIMPLVFCKGDSISIYDSLITSNSQISKLFKSVSGCNDSFQILQINFNDKPLILRNLIESCFGDSVLLLNKIYYSNAIIIDTIKTQSICDSIVQYEIKFNPEINKTILDYSICYGDSLIINRPNGIFIVKDRNNIIDFWKSINGCDSIVVYNIEKLPKYESVEQIYKCKDDTLFYNGNYYYAPTIITELYQSSTFCDSIHKVEIKNYVESISTSELLTSCYYDSIQVNSNWFKTDTVLNLILNNRFGCDSIHQVKLQFEKEIKPSILNYKICFGDSIQVNGKWYKDSARLREVIVNSKGCDSIVEKVINLGKIISKTKELFSFCPGDSIWYKNKWYFDSTNILEKYLSSTGCDSIHEVQLALKSAPSLKIIKLDICQGDSTFVETEWIKDPKEIIYHKPSSGECDSTIKYIVDYFPEIRIELTPELNLSEGDKVSFDPGIISGAISYHWSPSDGLSCIDCLNPILTATVSQIYVVEITDEHGCIHLDSISIKVKFDDNFDIFYPTVFSPNGDLTNDTWFPIFDSDKINILKLSIFDRWGNLISNKKQAWDGKFNEQYCQPGVFVYVLEFSDRFGNSKIEYGNITLLR